MSAYYNEHDPKAAAWLRELIRRNLIAPGEVDERSIVDVRSDDLRGYGQCHFFAGIGVWSYALRLAGWDDARLVWTGSCPCQPFSAAGKGEAYADERHLWPHWYRLIGEYRPATIFGEQVDAAIRTGWLDDVCLSLESLGYAVGAVDFPACSVGAPHIRQRLYFVADAGCNAVATRGPRRAEECEQGTTDHVAGCRILGDADEPGSQRRSVQPGERAGERALGPAGFVDDVGDTDSERCEGIGLYVRPRRPHEDTPETAGRGPTNGFWGDAEWIACRDGKARPVEPGTSPLVTGATARVVKLRGYGNAINAEAARAFIEAFIEGVTA